MTTLAEWAAQFSGLQKSTRALWMAIRWEFEEQEPPMTVRQMFYRMAAVGAVEKTEGGYRRVQRALYQMRRRGAIPYGWIADNTRYVSKPKTYNSLADMLFQQQQLYRRALWSTAPVHVEFWLEKDALRGVIGQITNEYDVPLCVTRGYASLSYLYDAAEILKEIQKPIVIYHLGDYDASGKDAARAIREGLQALGAEFRFIEAAVREEQIGIFNLQTRPAKRNDPRAKSWGKEAVELDAIPPADLREMVRTLIEYHIDHAELDRLRTIERAERASLDRIIENLY